MKHSEKYISAAVLVGVVFAGAALHFYRIGFPGQPVFDEVHFTTYAADYLNHVPFFDIHPPLGKLIFASALSFYPAATYAGAAFLTITKGPQNIISFVPHNIPFGAFPYVALRVTDALFGILIPLALYFFMRNVGVGRVASALAAAFVLFENALLVNTRFVLMDGMFILFGLAALAIYFYRGAHGDSRGAGNSLHDRGRNGQRHPIAAGAVWGLSLGVKLTGVVFAGPVIVAYLLARFAYGGYDRQKKREEKRAAVRFFTAGFGVLAVIILAGTLYFSTAQRLDALAYMRFFERDINEPTLAWQAEHPVASYFLADFGELAGSINGYATGDPAQGESPWYFWPAMQTPVVFYIPAAGIPSISEGAGAGGTVALVGNSIVWYASTLAAIAALAFLYRYLRDYIKRKHERRPYFILFGGYLLSLAPFIVLLHRSTYLYHYFPSLLFAIGLLAWFIERWLKLGDWRELTPRSGFMLGMILVLVIAGFLAAAPYTYGL